MGPNSPVAKLGVLSAKNRIYITIPCQEKIQNKNIYFSWRKSILKIKFLHEKIIFFDLDFFLTRYGYVVFKNDIYNIRESCEPRTAGSSSNFHKKSWHFWNFSEKLQFFIEIGRWPGRRWLDLGNAFPWRHPRLSESKIIIQWRREPAAGGKFLGFRVLKCIFVKEIKHFRYPNPQKCPPAAGISLSFEGNNIIFITISLLLLTVV